MEEMIYDGNGALISDNVSSYKLPSCGDVPLDWDVELLNYEPTTDEIGLCVCCVCVFVGCHLRASSIGGCTSHTYMDGSIHLLVCLFV